ncbi:PTS lactose/cellobiose transporter subunit IIA [Neobacillus piezotolerans]|uniref:PTS lactose/cellobiose transporter subunit IIA n=1 Tax=Neobacillus piezotolerans TaxID=2259171 RepID=A0A3D8GTP1_9BACI|nr:PTS lactose/cellobiose transporter subunit IIA [Neobacillus piezotolerans]RDU37840.1 PTS lactose/cellobiose transporter subunit IIA [Neobacillus piezotolerans]
MENNELVCFQIISTVGTAKSMYLEAIQEAKKGEFEKAVTLIEEGHKIYAEGHHIHAKLIQKEARGEKTEIHLLLLHAEDQMMSAETVKIMAEEFIEVYKKLEER